MTVGTRGRMIAVDHSADMIGGVWPGCHRPHDAVVHADWRAMPLARRSIDVVLGDNVLCPLPYPAARSRRGDRRPGRGDSPAPRRSGVILARSNGRFYRPRP